jgi:hypothetical protein
MPYPDGHDNPKVAAIIATLQRWFDGMKDGRAFLWQADPHYRRSRGGEWTEEMLAGLIRGIDEEFQQELDNGWPQRELGVTEAPGFSRLGSQQRLALAQELDAVLTQYPAESRSAYTPDVGDE